MLVARAVHSWGAPCNAARLPRALSCAAVPEALQATRTVRLCRRRTYPALPGRLRRRARASRQRPRCVIEGADALRGRRASSRSWSAAGRWDVRGPGGRVARTRPLQARIVCDGHRGFRSPTWASCRTTRSGSRAALVTVPSRRASAGRALSARVLGGGRPVSAVGLDRRRAGLPPVRRSGRATCASCASASARPCCLAGDGALISAEALMLAKRRGGGAVVQGREARVRDPLRDGSVAALRRQHQPRGAAWPRRTARTSTT